ncbi:telomere-associated protein RIF1-like [Hibiscus syriacus]|uniref:telomere-associated protein RIF1-like n=1 Tax=Hibiscus syriacus TaxID=106335 RepID=UPI0019209EF9|nr:telomere-associated protein RIF1-like [Hibiscus syriacus]
MKFLYINMAEEQSSGIVNSRVFSALTRFISCLHSKQDILSFFEIISGSLFQWLSHQDIKDENVKDQLRTLWDEILNCLRRSQPLPTFNSSFLKLKMPFLEKTLDHRNTSISDETIIFWNSTYGKQINLEYPQNLLHVLHKLLHKLSRIGRISLYKNWITATQNRSSK